MLELNTPINNLTNVISINLALGANQGRGRLFVPRPTLMGQVTTEGSNHGSRPSGASVSFDTLDNLVKSLGIDQVSAIKVDVEGAELAVIRGAEKTISKFGPRLVIEVHGNDNLTSLRHVMKSMNMRVVFEVPASPRRDETRVFVFAVPFHFMGPASPGIRARKVLGINFNAARLRITGPHSAHIFE
ncbi:FkbM family methyltransferase [Candidatus Bathyarchaeota archaeon]|nr:MAG: FkbM family methyltransferase [Candidatus Bathyarchaeota archaeon]